MQDVRVYVEIELVGSEILSSLKKMLSAGVHILVDRLASYP